VSTMYGGQEYPPDSRWGNGFQAMLSYSYDSNPRGLWRDGFIVPFELRYTYLSGNRFSLSASLGLKLSSTFRPIPLLGL